MDAKTFLKQAESYVLALKTRKVAYIDSGTFRVEQCVPIGIAFDLLKRGKVTNKQLQKVLSTLLSMELYSNTGAFLKRFDLERALTWGAKKTFTDLSQAVLIVQNVLGFVNVTLHSLVFVWRDDFPRNASAQ